MLVHHIDLAEGLLQQFVSEAGSLYGQGIYVYNVHSLLHLADDVRRFGPLDQFSAFGFENFLYKLKTLIKSKARALQQVIRRLHEESWTSESTFPAPDSLPQLSGQHSSGPVPPGFQGHQYAILRIEGTVLKNNKMDNCVLLKNGHIVLVANFLQSSTAISFCGQYFRKLNELYSRPVPSSQLFVFAAKSLSQELAVWNYDDILHKCVCLPIGVDCYVVFPLLHTQSSVLH